MQIKPQRYHFTTIKMDIINKKTENNNMARIWRKRPIVHCWKCKNSTAAMENVTAISEKVKHTYIKAHYS